MATDSRANNGDSKSDVESRQGIPFLGRLDPTAAYAHQHNHTVRRLVYFVLGCSSLTVAEKGIALLVMLVRRLSCCPPIRRQTWTLTAIVRYLATNISLGFRRQRLLIVFPPSFQALSLLSFLSPSFVFCFNPPSTRAYFSS